MESDAADLLRLGAQELAPEAYWDKINRMIQCLDDVSRSLRKTIDVATAYPDELAADIDWAQSELDRLQHMQRLLRQEKGP